jgi:hypothetical protein
MTTTLKHPMIREAERIIADAADLLEKHYHRDYPRFGIPEAMARDERPERVVAERALVNAGLDVWWSELLCIDGPDAAARMREVLPLKAESLYGPNAEAILGLLSACGRIDAAHLNGLANLVCDVVSRCRELVIRSWNNDSMAVMPTTIGRHDD